MKRLFPYIVAFALVGGLLPTAALAQITGTVRTGTAVSFPNNDDIRHHVYSFSEAKKFELPLYKGVPAEPVVFDQAGTVVLGCNIHDWMLAYVYVVDTPWRLVTDEKGAGVLDDLPAGRYRVDVLHPRLKGELSIDQ